MKLSYSFFISTFLLLATMGMTPKWSLGQEDIRYYRGWDYVNRKPQFEIRRGKPTGVFYRIIFDDKGNMVQWERKDQWIGLNAKQNYRYDEYGNLIRTIWYRQDGSPIWVEFYTPEGLRVQKDWYHSDGSLLTFWKYHYDSKNREIKREIYDSDSQLSAYYQFEYNGASRKKTIKKYNRRGILLQVQTEP